MGYERVYCSRSEDVGWGTHAGSYLGSLGARKMRCRPPQSARPNRGREKKTSDNQYRRSITLRSPSSPNGTYTRQHGGRSYLFIGFASFPTPRRSLRDTLRLYHDRQLPTTKGPGKGHFCTEYGHRRPLYRQGGHEHHPDKPRLWICGLASHNDPGEPLPPPR